MTAAVGERVVLRKTLTVAEQAMFTGISGNLGPLYVDARRARAEGLDGMASFELILAALASTCVNRIGGPGLRIARMDLRFSAAVTVGSTVEAVAELTGSGGGRLVLRLSGTLDGAGEVMTGEAELIPVRG